MTLLATLEADASTLFSGAVKLFAGKPDAAPATIAPAVAAQTAYQQAVHDGEAAVEALVESEAKTLINDALAKFGLGGLDGVVDAEAGKFLAQVLTEGAAILNAKIGA